MIQQAATARLLLLLLLSVTISHAQPAGKDFAARVNPMIGTGGHGHTYPGALLPFGMMQLSPDTRLEGWDGCSGYHYSDSVIYGFSHTHLSGTGCSDYGDILLMPATTDTALSGYGYASSFTHSSEMAYTGYYRVYLNKPRVTAELTASTRVGMHRYSFAESADVFAARPEEWLVVNLRHRDEVLAAHIEQIDSFTLRGYRFSKAWAANQKVFFEIKFSRPVIGITHASDTLITALHFRNQGPLLVKVAISAVSEEGAHKNMQTEMPDWNFTGYQHKAHVAWNNELSKLDAKGGTPDQQTIFYTALYHSMSAPNIYSDVDNRYRGRDDKIHSTGGTFDYYTVFSLWDTYRAEHPLLTIIDPKRTNDFINTFLAEYEQGGRLPVWELSSNETECMIGYHAVPVIWDAYSKGIRGYDAKKAYEAMKHSAMMDHFGLASYKKYGYVRADDEGESVSKTLEYAYDDWCIAQMADALIQDRIMASNIEFRSKNGKVDVSGLEKEKEYFLQRSQSWKNVFDPTTGFMRARRNGTLYTPFSPYTVDGNYTEANAWQYSFYVPHDVEGLIVAMGGPRAFESRLDALFSARAQTDGREQPDISGLIGQYAHGNEPSHHIAYLYNYIGAFSKTQAVVKHVMDSFYHNAPDGLIGNEDCGQMSAWYVMSAMGFYPVCPGKGHNYDLGYTPFDSVSVQPSPGASFTLKPGFGKAGPVTARLDYTYAPAAGQASIEFFRVKELVAAPFIIAATPFFRGSQTIRLQSLSGDQRIMYRMGDEADFKRYDKPIELTSNALLHFYTMADSNSLSRPSANSPVQEAFFTRLPDDRHITLHSTYNKGYSAGGPEALIDGQHGTTAWRSGGWQGYQGQDFEAVVALKGAPGKVSGVKASFLEDQNAWIFYPTAVSFYASDDSVSWRLIETIPTNKSSHFTAVTTSVFSTQKPVTARYIKVVAKSFGKMPEWHEGRGEPTFIFIDEIEVR